MAEGLGPEFKPQYQKIVIAMIIIIIQMVEHLPGKCKVLVQTPYQQSSRGKAFSALRMNHALLL
jgi:hypothetical protein